MKKTNRLAIKVLSLIFCFVLVLGMMPPITASASTTVPGAEGHEVTNFYSHVFSYGYASNIFIYATPGAFDLPYTNYNARDDGGVFSVPNYDKSQWYFAGWKTWYKGSHSGANVIKSNKANPQIDDNDYYFNADYTPSVKYPLGHMTVLKEYFWKGDYYLSAIFEPLITINSGSGIPYTVSGATKRGDKYSVKYDSGFTIKLDPGDSYVVTGVSANYGTSYSYDAPSIKVNSVTRPATININAKLKQLNVTFDANGGTGTMEPQMFDYGKEQALNANAFTREGYKFIGWSTNSLGSGASYDDKEKVTFKPSADGATMTLYSQWEKLPTATVKTEPSPIACTYTGEAQPIIKAGTAEGGTMVYSLSEDGPFSAELPKGTDVGSYNVYYKVDGDEDHADSAVETVLARIEKATPTADHFKFSAPDDLNADGTKKEASVSTIDSISGMGKITVNYYTDDQLTEKIDGAPVKAGTYYVAVDVADDGKNFLEGKGIYLGEFTLTKSAPYFVPPTAKEGLEYSGNSQELVNAGSAPSGTTIYYSLDGQDWSESIPKETLPDTYTVYYKVDGGEDYFDIAQDSITAEIKRREIDIVWENTTLEYNSEEQSPTAAVANAVGNDDIKITVEGAKRDVGTNYTATAVSIDEKWDDLYVLPENTSTRFSIEPKQVTLNWSDTVFVYDAASHVPTANTNDFESYDDGEVKLVITGEQTNAGNYTAFASLEGTRATNYKLKNASIGFNIFGAPQTAPEVDSVNETISGKADGKIIDTTSEMEYRRDTDITYTAITGTEVADLAAGTYYVRYAAKTNYSPSPEIKVVINSGVKLQLTIEPAVQRGFSLTYDRFLLDWNGGATLTYTLLDGYNDDALSITVSGADLADNGDGTYTVSNAKSNVTVKVTGIADNTAPTAEITLDNNWNTFWNNITFGKFFNKTQTFTINADDRGSGIGSVSYYLSDKELTEEDVKAITEWKTYSSPVDVDPDRVFAIYAKVSDKAGNTIFLNSDGFILDATAPVISGIEDGGTYYGDTTFSVNEDYLDTVLVYGEPVELSEALTRATNNGQYTITADNAQHTIVATDKAGNKTEYTIGVYKIYTVTFMADDKEVISVPVNHGADATMPKVPAKKGYNGKWDSNGKNITEDTVITAVYTKVPDVVAPKTGDSDNHRTFCIAMMLLCAGAMSALWLCDRRKKAEN